MSLISFTECSMKRNCQQLFIHGFRNALITCNSFTTAPDQKTESGDFRVLDLKRKQAVMVRRKQFRAEVLPPRTQKMPFDQDWPSVWPGPRTFHPASVPLPIRQGANKLGPPPQKYGNAELMKIPNFLHLTPPAIKRHCDAIKKFCTPWPSGLETDDKCEKHFPIDVTTTDYCHSSPKIRDPLARIVIVNFKLSRLSLDKHARDKLLRLVGDRYDEKTDSLTIVTDRCPLKQQNYDYAMYLITAVFHESWKYEPWESTKSEADMEYYDWEQSTSKKNVAAMLDRIDPSLDIDNLPTTLAMQKQCYHKAIIAVFNDGETDGNLQQYKEAAKKLVFDSATL